MLPGQGAVRKFALRPCASSFMCHVHVPLCAGCNSKTAARVSGCWAAIIACFAGCLLQAGKACVTGYEESGLSYRVCVCVCVIVCLISTMPMLGFGPLVCVHQASMCACVCRHVAEFVTAVCDGPQGARFARECVGTVGARCSCCNAAACGYISRNSPHPCHLLCVLPPFLVVLYCI